MSEMHQVSVDARGDLIAADGVVIDRSNGEVFIVGVNDGHAGPLGGPAPHLDDAQEIPRTTGSTLLGGSGRNVIITGHGGVLDGIYRPGRPGFWIKGAFVLEVTTSSDATVRDATDVIATLSTGGLAPAGSYVASSYGETTYNSSAAFSLTGTKEDGWPGTPNNIEVTISEGTAMGGDYTTTDGINYVSAADSDWSIIVNEDGSADFKYLSEIIASRAAGDGFDPCGEYAATEAGKLYNPEFPEDVTDSDAETNPFGILTLTFNWAGTPDLDIGVEFLGETVGYGYTSDSPYLAWSGDNTTDGGPETVTIDLAQAWEDGAIQSSADITALADWYPPAGGSGPASLTVAYSLGGGDTYTLHPGSATPAVTPALALRITAAGAVAPTGGDWTAVVRAKRNVPTEGVVYLAIATSGGAITAATGPFFAAALPTSGSGTFYYPTALSDGAGKLTQVHTGPLLWTP